MPSSGLMGPWPTVCAMSLLRDTRAASVVGSWKRERKRRGEERRERERKGTGSFPSWSFCYSSLNLKSNDARVH